MIDWNTILNSADGLGPEPPRRVEKTREQWEVELDPEVFRVTRQAGTERPFSSQACGLLGPGRYHCASCDTLLFDAQEKFDSGTGWPSFGQPVEANVIDYRTDRTLGALRVETTCSVCDAHLGHVFPDGPAPSGLRYCMNGVALRKEDPQV